MILESKTTRKGVNIMSKKLVTLNLATANGYDLQSQFLATDKEIDDLKGLNGREINIIEDDTDTEYLGVKLAITDNDIKDIGETASLAIEESVGVSIRGVYIFDYIHLDEMFYYVSQFVRETYKTVLTRDALNAVDRYIATTRPDESKKEDGYYSEWHYEDIVTGILSVSDLKRVEQELIGYCHTEEEKHEIGTMVSDMVIKTLI